MTGKQVREQVRLKIIQIFQHKENPAIFMGKDVIMDAQLFGELCHEYALRD